MRVFISGQKHFGAGVLRLCLGMGVEVVAVCCPLGDKHLGPLAALHGIPVLPSGSLSPRDVPSGVDLGIAAHSFDYVGKGVRYATRLGWIGYHPSLLPRHRGRSSVEWAIRMGDPVTGGTVYWLNSGVDRGDIAAQDWCFIDPALRLMPPGEAASKLWRDSLSDMGLALISRVLADITAGKVVREPQDNRFSTWEPGTSPEGLYRPDALMLPAYTRPEN